MVLIIVSASFPLFSSRQARMIFAPNLANSLAVSKPIPALAPVIIMTCPVRSRRSLLVELLKYFFMTSRDTPAMPTTEAALYPKSFFSRRVSILNCSSTFYMRFLWLA